MAKPGVRGLYRHLLSVRTFAGNLRRRTVGFSDNRDKVASMLTEYRDAKYNFGELMKKEGIEERLRDIALTPRSSTDGNRAIYLSCSMLKAVP